MHKVGSKEYMSNPHIFMLFYLMDEIPFDLPHTVYINILTPLGTLGIPCLRKTGQGLQAFHYQQGNFCC